MRALITGFDAFDGDKINPSALAVRQLKRKLGGVQLHTAVLPTSYGRSAIALRGAIHEVRPDIVLCVGQAGGRVELCLERVAINVQDARIKDNDGKQPVDRPVVRDGPAAHFATLPIKACVAEMRKAGLPAAVSNTACTRPRARSPDGNRLISMTCAEGMFPTWEESPESQAGVHYRFPTRVGNR